MSVFKSRLERTRVRHQKRVVRCCPHSLILSFNHSLKHSSIHSLALRTSKRLRDATATSQLQWHLSHGCRVKRLPRVIAEWTKPFCLSGRVTLQCSSPVVSCSMAFLATIIHPYLHKMSVVLYVLDHLCQYLGQRRHKHVRFCFCPFWLLQYSPFRTLISTLHQFLADRSINHLSLGISSPCWDMGPKPWLIYSIRSSNWTCTSTNQLTDPGINKSPITSSAVTKLIITDPQRPRQPQGATVKQSTDRVAW